MRIRIEHVVVGFAVLILVMPTWARSYKGTWTVSTPVTIGDTQVKVGEYQLNADDAKPEVTVRQNGKMIANVPGHWVRQSRKADYTTVETEGGKVTLLEFGGSDQAFQPQ